MSVTDPYSFLNPPAWMDDALCAQVDPELFFPEPGAHNVSKTAKSICARCEVRDACRQYAAATAEEFGIWGGLGERQRRKGRRRKCQDCGITLAANASSRIKRCGDCGRKHKAGAA